jgi:hypothetical protein
MPCLFPVSGRVSARTGGNYRGREKQGVRHHSPVCALALPCYLQVDKRTAEAAAGTPLNDRHKLSRGGARPAVNGSGIPRRSRLRGETPRVFSIRTVSCIRS